MGHLINPTSTRIGILRIWNANWITFSNNLKYTYLLNKDFYIFSIVRIFFSNGNFIVPSKDEDDVISDNNNYINNIMLSHVYILRTVCKIFVICYIYDPSRGYKSWNFKSSFAWWLKFAFRRKSYSKRNNRLRQQKVFVLKKHKCTKMFQRFNKCLRGFLPGKKIKALALKGYKKLRRLLKLKGNKKKYLFQIKSNKLKYKLNSKVKKKYMWFFLFNTFKVLKLLALYKFYNDYNKIYLNFNKFYTGLFSSSYFVNEITNYNEYFYLPLFNQTKLSIYTKLVSSFYSLDYIENKEILFNLGYFQYERAELMTVFSNLKDEYRERFFTVYYNLIGYLKKIVVDSSDKFLKPLQKKLKKKTVLKRKRKKLVILKKKSKFIPWILSKSKTKVSIHCNLINLFCNLRVFFSNILYLSRNIYSYWTQYKNTINKNLIINNKQNKILKKLKSYKRFELFKMKKKLKWNTRKDLKILIAYKKKGLSKVSKWKSKYWSKKRRRKVSFFINKKKYDFFGLQQLLLKLELGFSKIAILSKIYKQQGYIRLVKTRYINKVQNLFQSVKCNNYGFNFYSEFNIPVTMNISSLLKWYFIHLIKKNKNAIFSLNFYDVNKLIKDKQAWMELNTFSKVFKRSIQKKLKWD